VRHIEANEFYRWFDRVSGKKARRQLEKWQEDFDQVLEPRVTDRQLIR
jgi:hypothetical protein